MKSLFLLMVALAIPFWSLSRSSVDQARRLQVNRHVSARCGYQNQRPRTNRAQVQVPTPSASPAPRSFSYDIASWDSPIWGSRTGIATNPCDANAPSAADLSATIVRHDRVVAVADALMVSPICDEQHGAGERSWGNSSPFAIRLPQTEGWSLATIRPVLRFIPADSSGTIVKWLVDATQYAGLENTSEVAERAPTDPASPIGEVGTTDGGPCEACSAATWWQQREMLDSLLSRLPGEGFVEPPVADAEGFRVLGHWAGTALTWVNDHRNLLTEPLFARGITQAGATLGRVTVVAADRTAEIASRLRFDDKAEADETVWVEDVREASLGVESGISDNIVGEGWQRSVVEQLGQLWRSAGQWTVRQLAGDGEAWSTVVWRDASAGVPSPSVTPVP